MLSVICALCGASTVQPVASPGMTGSGVADFDTRPGEPLRSGMSSWVQGCRNCGYCADDISRAAESVSEIVASPAYRVYLDSVDVPSLARHFLCYSLLLEKLHQHADAGWTALHAAWACDDEEANAAARECRERAITLWQKGKAAGQQFAPDLASEFAIVVDVYRRTGQFEHATVACSEGLELEDVPPLLEQLFRRQMVLIQRRDTSAHTLAELTSEIVS